MKINVISQPDSRYSKLKPNEDAYWHEGSAFAVSDGITRDPIGLNDFSSHDWSELLKTYPKPSPAAGAAMTAAKTFAQQLNKIVDPHGAIVAANQAVAKLNEGKIIDYLQNDYAAAVLAGGIIQGSILKWAAVGDCRVAVYSSGGLRRFISPDGLAAFTRYVENDPGDWNLPEQRRKIRHEFRNNPTQIINGSLISYGALTGEAAAENFIMSGKVALTPGDQVICFSDGFTPLVETKDFSRYLGVSTDEFTQWDQDYAASDYHYGHERTIIIVK